ncbi:MAG: hypothetical protein Q9226_009408 [Calogaya cf. arnoldii]
MSFGPDSHTEYDQKLGFLSSSWNTCMPAKDFEEMKANGDLSVASLQSHCEGQPDPSEWISLSSEVSWMLEHIKNGSIYGSSVNGGHIALISTAKLERLKILVNRSDLLVQKAGGSLCSYRNPDGVKFAWPSHYLAYGWIPKQCIVKIFTLPEFRDSCEERNIRPDGIESVDPYTLLPSKPDAFFGSVLPVATNEAIELP